MKRKIADIIVITITLMIILTIVSFATTGTVDTESLNLRKEASTESNIIEILNNNEKIEILSEEGDWYKVKHNENTGYVNKKYIKAEESMNSEQTSNVETSNQSVNNETETTILNSGSATNFAVATVEGNIVTIHQNTKIRIIPAINANVVTEVTEGSQLEIIAKINHWLFIQNDEISGWIPYHEPDTVSDKNSEPNIDEKDDNEGTDDIKSEEEKQEETNGDSDVNLEEAATKYVSASSVYLRSKPTTDSEALTSLIRNTDVKVVGEEDGWYKVVYNDMKGYIREDLLSDTKTSETSRDGENINRIQYESASGAGNDIVNYAYGYLGCPYVYGGSGPSSFDCSGFTAYVYNHFGYSLPHSAVTQMNYGVAVDIDNLQPGDLVFFLDYQTMDGVGHCGIYIGDGNFIHASSGSGYCVKTSTLLTGSYRTRYYTARRLV